MHGKEQFLVAFDASPLAVNAHPAWVSYIKILLKTGVGALAALCVAAGVSAYADTTNVPVTNPLYPLKRLGESVQLVLAPTPEKAQLQAAFAVRRAKEIDALQVTNPTSTLIPRLTTDLDEDISGSLAAVGVGTSTYHDNNNPANNGRGRDHNPRSGGATEQTSTIATTTIITSVTTTTEESPTLTPAAIKIYCAAFNMGTSGALFGHLEDSLSRHAGGLAQFVQQCDDNSDKINYGARVDTTTTTASTTPREKEDRGGRIDIGL